MHTTGSFPVLQCNPRQKPFVAFGNVPIADSYDFEDRSLVVVVRNAKAVTQIAVSFSWTWPTLEQRKPTATTGSLREVQLNEIPPTHTFTSLLFASWIP